VAVFGEEWTDYVDANLSSTLCLRSLFLLNGIFFVKGNHKSLKEKRLYEVKRNGKGEHLINNFNLNPILWRKKLFVLS